MLYLSAIVLAIFLSALIITKRNKSYSDYLLSAWMFLTGFHLYAHYLFLQGAGSIYPSVVVAGFSFPLIQGPFLFLYTRSQLSGSKFSVTDLLHFVPVLVSLLLFSDFHFYSHETKLNIFKNEGKEYELRMNLNLLALYFSGVIYIILSFRKLVVYRRALSHRFSNIEKIKFDWLLYLLIWLAIIWLAILITRNDTLIFGSASLFVLWIGYFGIKQVKVFSQPQSFESDTEDLNLTNTETHSETQPETQNNAAGEQLKYQRSGLSETDAEMIYTRLKKFLTEDKPFKNPELKLDDLAKSLNVHPNHLSQVINSKEKKNFYDLINELRIKEFISQASAPANQQFTILAIAFDCGFNSKTSFNRNFKKLTGLTPSYYLKMKAHREINNPKPIQ